MSIQYKGSRWVKCDLHLHTPASKCFEDKTVTPEQWINRAIEQGLNCVAVTDHNTGEWIDRIKDAAQGKPITVFPGVEITCDTSKVHLLVLFDTDKNSNDVNDFLIRCEIDREMFAEQSAGTTLSIFEVVEKAHQHSTIIIPAHIDEFNGLGSISHDNLNAFFELPYINAVQVVHEQFIDSGLQTNNNDALKTILNDYYGNPNPLIDYTKIGEWYRPVKKALERKLAITTFSDNPHQKGSSKHGLFGLGNHFTWIKMDEIPTLEGLRQAFLLPDFRVKNEFISSQIPYKTPELWIKSIAASNITITDENAFKIEFSPQLTTIIGGRGSGKSSILRFLRGLFNRTADIIELEEILKDHQEFYTVFDPRSQKGVLTGTSIIEVEFVRNSVLYKITATNITNSDNQTISIQKFDEISGTWSLENADRYIDFFLYEQYSQKQIYEIAQEPNSLRERIDNAIFGLDILKNDREIVKKSFFEKSASIRTKKQQIVGKGKITTEISDLEDRIKKYQQSGIAGLLNAKEKFTLNNKIISNFIEESKSRVTEIQTLIDKIELSDIDYTAFYTPHADDLKAKSKLVVEGFHKIKTELEGIHNVAGSLIKSFEDSVIDSQWEKDNEQNQKEFDIKKTELEKEGIDDISNFEKLTQEKELKEKELEKIEAIEKSLTLELPEKVKLQEEYLVKAKEITDQRKAFVIGILQDDKVKVSINSFRNKNDFVNKLRAIIQRESGFQSDINTLSDICFTGNVEQTIKTVREIFYKIKRAEPVHEMTGYFVNLVESMTEPQMDEIDILLPEDEIDIKYKPSGSDVFKPLSTASAGQKTTAILTFILTQGSVPLVLDQPEDDLDNRLVYELIVDRLKQAKEYRQLIVVTHNANIPVNGDAEYIVSMNFESKKLEIYRSGTIEQPEIKKEICDVMEGGEQAFEMRSRRYKQIK